MPRDLHELPKLKDSLSYTYIEHAIIEQDNNAIVIIRKDERIPVPVASMTVLMIGPGTTITHAAVKAICDNGCLAVWCGDHAMRYYAFGMGETRSSANLLKQASLCMDEDKHLEVVKRLYELRFPKIPVDGMSLQQLRGLEGVRVREVYKQMSKIYGVKWRGRDYNFKKWDDSDPLNRALSMANVCLYGLCQAAIVSLGYSPGLGFIHTGKLTSFVYDIADLYKMETTIPAAFETVSKGVDEFLERNVRIRCRGLFKECKVLKRIAGDIAYAFDVSGDDQNKNAEQVGDLWDGEDDFIAGGVNYSGDD